MAVLRKIATVILISCITGTTACAQLKLSQIFQSNMVLQRGKPVPVWGFATAGEKITLHFKTGKYSAVTAKDGTWSIKLPKQTAGGPYELRVKGKSDSIALKNILFGDVWICGGQSNMQYTLSQIGYTPKDTAAARNPNIRLFTATIDMDYVPKKDLSGGSWAIASVKNISNFSAAAYFFGRYLADSIDVPIGLVSINLGATSVETWMSAAALSPFPQFKPYVDAYLAPAMSFKEITAAFEKTKPEWEQKYYLKGKGMEDKWYLPETDISGWKTTEVPCWWEDHDLADFDGAVWFRKSFDLSKDFKGDHFLLQLNQIDDYDLVWINGVKVGEGFGNQNWRNYQVPANLLKPADNVIVVRVFDVGGKGGMYSGAIWGNPVLLGKWNYKQDLKIDAALFPKPHVVNVSPFSTPAVLYNGNIAPVTQMAVKGFIWYQGESNAGRATEYRNLFQAMIKDWRKQFKQGDVPFLFAQLANYMAEAPQPRESDWAELREAQSGALTLPNTGMAVLIDIGEAGDIHPKNKMDVGRRLSLEALNVAYHKNISSKGPTYAAMEARGDSIIIHYVKGTDLLYSKEKYLKGFAIADRSNRFSWAKAFIKGNSVVVHCDGLKYPVSVRYAWSDNPGPLNLYNTSGLPAAPFRTDRLPAKTAHKLFSEDPWVF
jgi:sialate O-acetylesterase